ncbi:MAG: hypothetical protein AAGA75_20580 [Cyanobacteria bacterium P01_E01_bin.6]
MPYKTLDADGSVTWINKIGPGTEQNPFTEPELTAGENHIGSLGGHTGFSVASFTRPNDASTYNPGDAIANSTSGASNLTFANAARVAGGNGYVQGALLETSHKAFSNKLLLYLYSVNPTAVNDNAAFNQAPNANFITWITFDGAQIQTDGGSGSTVGYIDGLPPNNTWKPFVCGAGSTAIFGQLVTPDGFTPIAQASYRIWLYVTKN